ncbi:hypothetical protein CWM61_03420 [Klebsiella sp. K-Nf6]|nr:hypothetical protein CWM61_03420 [Klebsiella sp. K-Nf6]
MPGRISFIRRTFASAPAFALACSSLAVFSRASFGTMYCLPLQGKEISTLPARVSKSDGIFCSREVYHKAKKPGEVTPGPK